ncbi:MAG: UbiA family prenyltransferase [Methanocellales archaeon]|nr:UbiA family prenyltransferase [Methanocellales archaeon]
MIYSSVYLSFSGISMIYVSCVIQGIQPDLKLFLVIFLVTFSVYNVNRMTDEKEDSISHSERYDFTQKHGKLLLSSALLGYILAILLAMSKGVETTLVSLIPLFCGILYSVKWIPKRFKYRRLKEIPFAKNIIIAFAWASTTTFLPCTMSNVVIIRALIIYVFFFVSVFVNCVVFDMRDTEGDAISGVKTIPAVIGLEKTKKFLIRLNLLVGLLIFVLTLRNLLPIVAYWLCFATIYTHLYVVSFDKEGNVGFLCDVIADGQPMATGILVYTGNKLIG